MANKENIEQLTDYINKLKKLAESIYEREIYPVSFFSQAFDITNKIQDSLHQIEMVQIELFEKQMKEHQAQIRNIQRTEKKQETPQTTSTIEEQLSKTSSVDDSTQVISPKTDQHIIEKETIIENKKTETEYKSPTIEEKLQKTSSVDDSTQVILPKTDQHIIEKETIIENKKTETEYKSPISEEKLQKNSSIDNQPQTISSETSQRIIKEQIDFTKKAEMKLPSLEEKLQITGNSLDKKFEKKTLSDLKKAFTINDRFRFCRELFSSNENLMNQAFSELNDIESYNASVAYIKEHFNWNWEEEVTVDFISMIEKRFE
ncbi:MAG: hypothetical protein LBV72_01905 [Tannerella sp.]|jgi:hypothetical protein|nr:hypothetical protein [Tannerella sp.]